MKRNTASASLRFVIVCALVGSTDGFAQTPPPVHLVIPFANATREPRLYWLSEASAVLLADDLQALGAPAMRREDRLRAFERLRVPPVSTLSHATVIRLGQLVGASTVVIGSYQIQDDALTVRARSIRLDTGRMSPELVERGPLADMLETYGRLAQRIVPESGVPADPPARLYPSLAAFEQYIKGLLAEAPDAKVAFLEQALRLVPAFPRARIALWDVRTDQGDHRRAMEAIRQVPAADPLVRQARFLGAVSMLHLGQPQAAFAEFSALNEAARDPALFNNMGVAQLRRRAASPGPSPLPGVAGRAVSYFGDAAMLDGSDPDLFFNTGYAYWLDRDAQGAIASLREAVRRNPADDAAHYVLGVALQSSGSTAEAAREKELARRLSSTYVEWEQQHPGANTVPPGLERLKTDLDVPASLRVDAAVVAAEQRDQRAIAAFHLDAGRRLFQEGRDEEAVGELRRTIFLAPYESQAHLLLGRIYLRTGRRQDAIDALTIAVWSDPADGEGRALLESVQ
ncbi:MAG: tetratricopeptide repeat protein [Acidobacteria bacterium]|nr:tetratricopeptide repeat protein [Acidobacteriota bacterium]